MKFTDEQRLIVLMLADIQKALKVRGEFDPSFISKVTAYKEEFAIPFEHGLLFDDQDLPDSFKFVIDVLDMWSFIERAVKDLDEGQRQELIDRVGLRGDNPQFRGFDGNNETELMAHCRLLVNDLHRFTEFKDRDFNSHSPTAELYREMYELFEPMRRQLLDRRRLSLDDLEALLSTR
ncbi:YfbU family protein [Stenotrophomonas sp. 57]|uniref:YfbU family protein n=1 Tax=Stenotrophomonas sp. 57 TaxID=3051119 RepID=UPI00256F0D6E|nr:YfbU family protein [Stenotrophomonas sp. 57]